jgi:hypothetical protein
MRVRLTVHGETVLISQKGKPVGEVPLTPELAKLLDGRSRVFTGTYQNHTLTLKDEHDNEVA